MVELFKYDQYIYIYSDTNNGKSSINGCLHISLGKGDICSSIYILFNYKWVHNQLNDTNSVWLKEDLELFSNIL